MKKINDKYRIPSARLAGYDYGADGIYFITICTKHRKHYFGEIIYEEDEDRAFMQLSPLGLQAWKCWYAIPEHFPFVQLGEAIVMPNHMHGILVIDKFGHRSAVETQDFASPTNSSQADEIKETQNPASLQPPASLH